MSEPGLWRNARLSTLASDADWGLVDDGALLVDGDTLAWVGPLAELPAAWRRRVAREHDLGGALVTPGLVDLHTHVYHGVTFWGVKPDPVAAHTGVTTWLDVGSAGAYNLMGFRDFIVKPADARIYSLLNISSIGLTAQTGELANLSYCDADLCCKMLDLYRNLVLGIKARIDVNTTGGQGLEPLRLAREAADRAGEAGVALDPDLLEFIEGGSGGAGDQGKEIGP